MNIYEMAHIIQDKKNKIMELSNEIRHMEHNLKTALVTEGLVDALSINYTKLRQER